MAKKKAYQASTLELQCAPALFLYELRVFLAATSFLQDPAVQNNPSLKNAILESALLHSRNILDFFCAKESSIDDISAGHFVKNADGTPWTSFKLSFLISCKGDINKSLSHLTYTRVKFKPSWNMTKIRQEIEDAYSEFVTLLPLSERPKWTA